MRAEDELSGEVFDRVRGRAWGHHEADLVLKAGCAHKGRKMTGYLGEVCPDCHSVLEPLSVWPSGAQAERGQVEPRFKK